MTAADTLPMAVPIAVDFRKYIDKSLLRLGYLRPDVIVEVAEDQALLYITSVKGDVAGAAKDVRYCLYREKIYAETFELRGSLIYGLMGK